MTTLTEFKEIETPLLKFLRYFRDEKATGTLAYDELQHHIAEYTALIAVAEGMATSMENLKPFFKDYVGQMVISKIPGWQEIDREFQQALAAYEAWKLNIEGEK